jgi:hypothetical protein
MWRSPRPYRPAVRHSGNKQASRANRGCWCPRRTERPSRRGQARPGGRTSCTTRSSEPGPQPQPGASSAVHGRVSSMAGVGRSNSAPQTNDGALPKCSNRSVNDALKPNDGRKVPVRREQGPHYTGGDLRAARIIRRDRKLTAQMGGARAGSINPAERVRDVRAMSALSKRA